MFIHVTCMCDVIISVAVSSGSRSFYRILKQIHWLPERFRIWRGDHSAQQLSTLTSPGLHIQNHATLLGIGVSALAEGK